MAEQQDLIDLNWVNSEIKDTLAAIKESLEKHLEQPAGHKHLVFCQARLHQVQGSLKMLPEIKGASLLTEELLGVVDALLNNQVSNAQFATETLMQGVSQLSLYIERTAKTKSEQPTKLIELLNALRNIRSQPELTDLDFFQPVIDNKIQPIDEKQMEQLIESGALKLLRKIRQKYQICLASYLRQKEVEQSLAIMTRLFGKLQNLCWGSPSSPLWDASAALIEGLSDHSIQQTDTSNSLLKELDHQLKLLIESKGWDLNQPPGEPLLKKVLYQIANAKSDGNLIQAQKQRYQLKNALSFILPEKAEIDKSSKQNDHASGSIKTVIDQQPPEYNPVILDDIHKIAILEARTELSYAKQAIDDYLASHNNVEYLSKIPKLLESAENTLSMPPLSKCSGAISQLAKSTKLLWLQADRHPSNEQLDNAQKTLTAIEEACSQLYKGNALDAEKALDAAQRHLNTLIELPEPSKPGKLESMSANDLKVIFDEKPKKNNELEPEDKNKESFNKKELTFDYSQTSQAETVDTENTAGITDSVSTDNQNEQYDELISGFSETATAIQQTLASKLSLWIKNPKNIDALKIIRRSFNTLKNSARASEASVIGELASAVENMLNRLLSGHIKASGNIFSLLNNVIDLLPNLISDFQSKSQLLTAEVLLFMEQADDLARGDAFFDPEELKDIQAAESHDSDENQRNTKPKEQPTTPNNNDSVLTSNIDLLLRADSYLECWKTTIQKKELKIFKKELKLLAEKAFEANLTPLGLLCDVLQDVCHYLSKHEKNLPEILIIPLQEGFESLVDMVNQAAAGQTIEPPHSTFNLIRLSLESLLKERSQPTNQEPKIETDNSKGSLIAEENSQHQLASSFKELHTEEPSPQESPDYSFEEVVLEASNAKKEQFTVSEQPIVNDDNQQDQELINIFLEEASDITDNCTKALDNWLRHDHSIRPVAELQRNLHTLKGGARTVEFHKLGDLSHALESVYESLTSGKKDSSEAPLGLLQQAHDTLEMMLQAIQQNRPEPQVETLITQLEKWCTDKKEAKTERPKKHNLKAHLPDYLGDNNTVRQSPLSRLIPRNIKDCHTAEEKKASVSSTSEENSNPGDKQPSQEEKTNTPPINTQQLTALPLINERVRVSQDLLEQLCNLSAESSIQRSQVKQQTTRITHALNEMDSTIQRLTDQLRRLDIETNTQIISHHQGQSEQQPEFDPLELDQYSELNQLSNALTESASDLADLQQAIVDKNQNTEALLLQQSRAQNQLQSQLSQIRMVSFNRLLPRLNRTVQKASTELNIPVEFKIANSQVKIDRVTLEKIQSPLEHLLRNAISHGIERDIKDRIRAGKPEKGQITLTLTHESNQVILELSDDGQGINLASVYEKAIEKKLISVNTKLSDNELLRLILTPGFSTANELTQMSGRGVGLDVVNSEVEKLGGNIRIESQSGEGTRFIIRLPVKSSVSRALMVSQGGHSYAFPLHSIDGLTTMLPQQLLACYKEEKTFEYTSIRHKVISFARLLGKQITKITSDQCPVIIIQRGGENIALHVDSVHGSQEIINKPLGSQFTGLTGVNGATILGDGSVAIVIDPAALISKHRSLLSSNDSDILVPEASAKEKTQRILVVDDSITMRKVTTRLLSRRGYDVDAAKDGVEAMKMLSENCPDLLLLDIEMPKMDGFEVASAVRNDSNLAQLPIIMVTSRTSEKHRNRALNLGANDYISKPFQEESLLKAIEKLIKKSEPDHN